MILHRQLAEVMSITVSFDQNDNVTLTGVLVQPPHSTQQYSVEGSGNRPV